MGIVLEGMVGGGAMGSMAAGLDSYTSARSMFGNQSLRELQYNDKIWLKHKAIEGFKSGVLPGASAGVFTALLVSRHH